MYHSSFGTFLILFLILGSAAAVVYLFYLSWFRPLSFKRYYTSRVRDWWPFADYYRRYYASASWLWIVRIATTVCIPLIVLLIYKLVTRQMQLP